MSKSIKIVELFSGIGGFTLGLKNAGYTITDHKFSEIDKNAIANYKYNFPHATYIGSVTDVQGSELRGSDVITFGSPCQDFSVAGRQDGLEGERSNLIMQAIRIITQAQPSFFIWENVKGAFSSNAGADFWAILQAFTHVGKYRLEWQLLNTRWFLPQNRERIYLIGHLAGSSTRTVFPISKNDRLPRFSFYTKKRQPQTKDSQTTNVASCLSVSSANMTADNTYIEVPKVSGCLTGGGNPGGLHSDMTTIKVKQLSQLKESNNKTALFQQNRYYDTDGIAPALLSQMTCGTHKIEVKPVLTPNRIEKRQNGRRFKNDNDPAFTLNCQDQHGILTENRIRRLTEIENERLQGFPDDWTRYGMFFKKSVQKYIYGTSKKWRTAQATRNLITHAVNHTTLQRREISQTNRYKMCGNAVSTPPVQVIGERLELINKEL